MKHDVFNNSVGAPYGFGYPQLTKLQESDILASLFEQLLIFDRVTISTNRLNFALAFLISKLGINLVEKLIELNYIRLMIWTPMIFTGTGSQREDGSIDESSIYGQPPIAAGTLSNEDMDPEHNIIVALSNFQLHRDRKRIFTKKALKSYVVPDGMEFSTDSSKLVIDAYNKNNLEKLGLPFDLEADQLQKEERVILLELSHKVIETALLSKFQLKSFENYEHYAICDQNLKNIGKAYNVAANTSTLFKLEELPNIKELYLSEKLKFDDVFHLRNLSNAKYYRKWINNIGENANAKEITKEYLNELKDNTKFFDSTKGKFFKNLALFGVGTALGGAISNPIVGGAVGYGLGLLDEFWLDSILKGKNPSMFITDIKQNI